MQRITYVKSLILLALFCVLMYPTSDARAQIGNGLATGKFGTFNTYSAYSLDKGHFRVYTQGRIFVEGGLVGTDASANLWNISNNLTFAYGITPNIDLLATVKTYQDLNIRSISGQRTSDAPGDVFLTLRTGSHPIGQGKVNFGGAFSVRLPTGKSHNVPLEVYSSEGMELGALGLLTIFGNQFVKSSAYLLNLNAGLWFHNDNGKLISPSKNVGSPRKSATNSMHLQYGLGFLLPVGSNNLSLDVHGITYLTEPDEFAYSREPFLYLTPGFRYQVRSWLSMGAYVDIRIAGSSDKTSYSGAVGVTKPGSTGDGTADEGISNYPSWRVGLNLGFNILPLSVYAAPGQIKRKQVLQKLLEEEKGTRKAANELQKLKQIRQDVEKELEKIRKELESK